MKSDAILDITEDLLDEDYGKTIDVHKKAKRHPHPQERKDRTPSSTFESLINDTAKVLQMNNRDLAEWLESLSAPKEVQHRLLNVAKQWILNPLLGQVDWEHHPQQGFEVFIPIDGWICLIHREPRFRGISFDQSAQLEHGIPIWMECTIYRSDLIQPITVREYFTELKTDHPVWDRMPRRMMRHKTLQQCARLAFGMHLPAMHDRSPIVTTVEKPVTAQKFKAMDSKQLLKEKLQSESINNTFGNKKFSTI